MRDEVAAVMTADDLLSGLLPGGVHTTRMISRALTPAAFDGNGEVQPCALVKTPSELVSGPNDVGGRLAVDIYLYERDGYTTIDRALGRLFALFHRQKVGAWSDQVFEMRWLNDVRDFEDTALECNAHLSRFEIVRLRG